MWSQSKPLKNLNFFKSTMMQSKYSSSSLSKISKTWIWTFQFWSSTRIFAEQSVNDAFGFFWQGLIPCRPRNVCNDSIISGISWIMHRSALKYFLNTIKWMAKCTKTFVKTKKWQYPCWWCWQKSVLVCPQWKVDTQWQTQTCRRPEPTSRLQDLNDQNVRFITYRLI